MRGQPKPLLRLPRPRIAHLQLFAVLTLLAGILGMHSLKPCDMGAPGTAAHTAAGQQTAAEPVMDASGDDCRFHQCSAIGSSAPYLSGPPAASWAATLPIPTGSSAGWTLTARRLDPAPPWTTYSLEQLSILRV